MKKSIAATHPLRNAPNISVNIAAMITGHTKAEVLAAASDPANGLQFEKRTTGQRKFELVERNEIVAYFLKLDAAKAEAETECVPA